MTDQTPVSPEAIIRVITEQNVHRPMSISEELGRDPRDQEVFSLLNSMTVSGYLTRSPLGALTVGPNRIPATRKVGGGCERPRATATNTRPPARQDPSFDGMSWTPPGQRRPVGVLPGQPVDDRGDLEEALAADDAAEDRGMHGDDRSTCGQHRRWIEDCIGDRSHANRTTRYNWCSLHDCAVQECRCWPANTTGRPLPGDEPTPTAEDWVDWAKDARVRSEGTKGAVRVTPHSGIGGTVLVRPTPGRKGSWTSYRPSSGSPKMFRSKHEALLDAVDGDLAPDAVRRPPPPYVDENWLTGQEDEDRLVRRGKCPYQTAWGEWGKPPTYCGGDRSKDEGDGEYCRRHAAEIRHDRGYGGYV